MYSAVHYGRGKLFLDIYIRKSIIQRWRYEKRGIKNSKHKGPEVGIRLKMSRDRKRVTVLEETEQSVRKVLEGMLFIMSTFYFK